MNKYDVKNLKEVVTLGAKVAEGLQKAKADGKYDANDIAYLLPIFPAVAPALEGIAFVPKEFADLSQAEVDELALHLKEQAPWLKDSTQLLTQLEACFGLAASIIKVYTAFKK